MESRIIVTFIIVTLQVIGVTGSPIKGTPFEHVDWWDVGQKELSNALQTGLHVAKAKNVIFFLGDGMGVSTVTAARWLQSQQRGESVKDLLLSWENFPHVALSRTYNTNQKTSDSAATATAFLSGVKARAGTIGVKQEVIRSDCGTLADHADRSAPSIYHKSHAEGKWTGLVTTARLSHATPAAAYAATADRDWETDADLPQDAVNKCKDIAAQLVDNADFIKVILGGGRSKFTPENMTDPEHPTKMGKRKDGRNLLQEWKDKMEAKSPASKVHLVMNRTDFEAVDVNNVDYLMGVFEPGHMQFEADREDPEKEQWGEPSLTEMTEKAINILKRSDEGYFLMVEGGRIDHGHHDGNAYKALTDTIAFSDAVKKATEMTDIKDTLIVVTADHSHVFTMGGYPSIETDIMGIADKNKGAGTIKRYGDDDLPYLILSYANGPGHYYHHTYNDSINDPRLVRRNLTEDFLSDKTADKEYLQSADVPLDSETHGGEDVAIYARGPMSHLFHGSHEQNYIAHVMMYASCVGANKDHCTKPRQYPGCDHTTGSATKHQVEHVYIVSSILIGFYSIINL